MSTTTAPRPPETPSRRRGRGVAPVAVLVGLTVCLWTPLLKAPLSSDEGGFLLLGGQWHSGGTSLYGNYWVDRPPLLIALFALAHLWGGAVPLRILGCLCASTSVVLSFVVGRRITGSLTAGRTSAAVTAALLATPLFDSFQVDGELLALPWVFAGLLAACTAYARDSEPRRAVPYWMAAGAAGACAALIKQNFIDVFVFAAVLLICSRVARTRSARAVLVAALGVAAGALAVTVPVLVLAEARGTPVAGLWDALVTFRAEASQVIADSASAATGARFSGLLQALLASGAAFLAVLVLALPVRRPLRPGLLALATMLAWQLVGVLGGGSYWLHYLVGLVPGLAMGSALLVVAPGPLAWSARVIVTYVVVVAAASLVGVSLVRSPPGRSTEAGRWLSNAVVPGDTATVLYGQPDILQAAGVSSPYPLLWSLPVRVRDPSLTRLAGVLDGPRAPTWLLVDGGLDTWGVDPAAAEVAVSTHYREVAARDGYRIYLHDGVVRELPAG